jgi:hypothetical protein
MYLNLSLNTKLKSKMGCDYFIIKQLRIEHSQGSSTIELDRERAYFPENAFNDADSDDSDFQERMNKQYESFLQVTYNPRMLYGVGVTPPDDVYIKTVLDTEPRWKNEQVKERYQERVNDELNKLNLNIPIIVYQIIKEEVRYLR